MRKARLDLLPLEILSLVAGFAARVVQLQLEETMLEGFLELVGFDQL